MLLGCRTLKSFENINMVKDLFQELDKNIANALDRLYRWHCCFVTFLFVIKCSYSFFFLNVASEEFAMEIEQYYLKLSDFLTS